MEKIKLKLSEVYGLSAELKGLSNQQTGEIIQKGILDENLSIKTKYSLSKVSTQLVKEIESVEKLREEMIKKYGDDDKDGNYFIPQRINEVIDEETKQVVSFDINPKFIQFQTEFESLLQEEVEIDYTPITLDQIDIKSEINPSILFKLVSE
jgi:hypothetical protein